MIYIVTKTVYRSPLREYKKPRTIVVGAFKNLNDAREVCMKELRTHQSTFGPVNAPERYSEEMFLGVETQYLWWYDEKDNRELVSRFDITELEIQ